MISPRESWPGMAIVLFLISALSYYSRLRLRGQAPQPVKVLAQPQSLKTRKLEFNLLSVVRNLIDYGRLLLQSRRSQPVKAKERPNTARIHDLKSVETRYEVASTLIELFEKDGAGAWPPKANHDAWPLALRPYKDICLELVPLLPTSEPSLDDEINNKRREEFRSLMQKLLRERINIPRVQTIMAAAEAENWDLFPRDAYNGFYCCVAVCRHAYRWATIPVVKVAQQEKIVDFPPELDIPWPYLQRNFGVTAESGNNTANVVHNFDEKAERVYKINIGISQLIQSSEDVFFRMFYDLEVLAFPIYYEMVCAIIAFESDDRSSCIKHLDNINHRLRHLLLIFFQGLTDSRVSRSVWLSYIQGFQGWGVGRIVEALDAFLGMSRYLTDENMIRYIPINQRQLCLTLKKHSFRIKVKEQGDLELEEKVGSIVKQLKMFRAAHRARVMPYLQQPAPERLTMTAGKSVLEGATAEETREALKSLDLLMATRLAETV